MDLSASIWQGRLVRLRAIEPDDWLVYFAWNQDNEMATVRRFMPASVAGRDRTPRAEWDRGYNGALPHSMRTPGEHHGVDEPASGRFAGRLGKGAESGPNPAWLLAG